MACRIRYLNSAGIMPREIRGVQALAEAFPPDWLFYVSLNCFPERQRPFEVDAFVVTDDRVLLLEIKDWNGVLTNQQGDWWLNKSRRGRSAVQKVAEKARVLKTVLAKQIKTIGSQIEVDSRVVLTGSADKKNLPPDQAQFTWTLAEARSLKDPTQRKKLLRPGTLKIIKLCSLEQEFDRITGNSKLFQPLEADWGGFQVTERDLFVHPKGIWADHLGVRRSEQRIKAMIRTWSFDKLPAGLNSNASRSLVAARETQAFAYLSEKGSALVKQNKVLRDIANDPDEILTQHFEVRALDDGWTTLDRYLEKRADDLSLQDRYILTSALLDLVAELHKAGMTHRDLGPRALWVGSPTGIALTGLMSCQLPDQGTVGDWLPELRGYAPPLPEELQPGTVATGRQRDVYTLGYLAALILTGERVAGSIEAAVEALPAGALGLAPWLRRALSSAPSERFSDAGEMLEEFSTLIEPPKATLDPGLLDRFETLSNPYVNWRVEGQPLKARPECTAYASSADDGRAVVVKIWNQARRGISSALDLALHRLLDSAARLKTAPVPGLPRFLDSGLSAAGPFVVYERALGEKLTAIAAFTPEDFVSISRSLIECVEAMHVLGCEHGDISTDNIVWDADRKCLVLLDPFDITLIGDGSLRTPAFCPENWESWGQMALDRFACLKVIETVAQRTDGAEAHNIRELLRIELARPLLETLDPVLVALGSNPKSPQPPAAQVEVVTFAETNGFQGGRGFQVQAATQEGMERLVLTSADGQLVLEAEDDKVKNHYFKRHSFASFAHQSRTGIPVDIEVTVSRGRDAGFDELYRALKVEPATLEIEGRGPTTDVNWRWRRLMELEEESRIEVGITDIIGTREGVIVCRYENLGREFDFDTDVAIDALNAANRRVGEVDRGLSDFPQTLALRMERRVTVGDRLWLVDRREQTSIERRARAVTRILEHRSAIPNLVEYFDPGCEVQPETYPVVPSAEELSTYSLNQGQLEAFQKLLESGPVGLLQGPPGTGKTRFIAAFVHWLLTRGGAQRILIASQSHEAVNNAIESLLSLYKTQGEGRPNLLRIGSKGITARIKPYHSAELRERYRLKFAAAAKYRFGQLSAAKGISRKFASEFFELDAQLGDLARKIEALTKADATSERVGADERSRRETRMRRAQNDFRKAALRLAAGIDADLAPQQVLEAATNKLIEAHPDVSPSDVAAAGALLRLTRDWIAALGSPQRNFEEFLAKTRNVVTATCVGVGQSRIRIDAQLFDWVIVDEAARCTSGELAVPIQMARRVLLVGDHLQLRPMVPREFLSALQEESSAEESRGELEASDFERAFTSGYGGQVSRRFTEQYRMDDAICSMVSKCFYEPHSVALQTSSERVGGLRFDEAGASWLRRPMTWIDTSKHPKSKEGRPHGETSRFNEAEVDAVIALLEDVANNQELVNFLSKKDDETPIGVICMYAAQKRKIEARWLQRAWEARFRRLVRIDTVDSYQGKENEIVIVSLVCNNARGDIGHVRSANRCNVALSRAKERLVVVGAAEMFAHMPAQTPITSVLTYFQRDSENAAVVPMEELR